MAMTRAEIEVLIKARNEATAAFTALSADVQKIVQSSQRGADAMEKLVDSTRKAKPTADAAGVAFGMLASTVATKLVQGFGSTIQAANKLDSAMVGLGATAKAFNVDANSATAAAQSLASDGLLSVGDAAAGLKNLLAAGFGLDEAVTLMNRFKDSAAFGRQGALSFGEAIKGATEGIKNGNSTLVDNAGVTKNLSVMLTEAGKSASDLGKASSDASVRQAIFNGILKETAPQLGNAALYLKTAAGQQAQFNQEIETAQAKLGKALQPALANLLSTLTPVIKAIGDNAAVLVPLGTAIAAVVGPLAAMRAAAALGIPSLATLSAKGVEVATSFTAATAATGSLRGGLNALAVQSGITASSLGLVNSAALAAGSAFIGWQLGRVIAELTGADDAVKRFTQSITGWTDQTERHINVQDTISRAVRAGAKWNIEFADAVKFLTDKEAIRVGQFNTSIDAQKRMIEAQVRLGEITREEANGKLALFAADEKALAIQQRRISAAAVQAAAEKQFQGEVRETGFTVAQLTANLKANESGFMAWASAIGLSDSTVKRLKDSLKTTAEQTKKNEQAAKDHQDKVKAMAASLEALGVVTLPVVNDKLKALDAQVKAATDAGVPFVNVVRAIWPELEKLAEQAKASGVGLDVVRAKMKGFESQGFLLQPTKSIVTFAQTMPVVTREMQPLIDGIRQQQAATERLNNAYAAFGLKTPLELRKVASESARNYQLLKESGTATTQQLAVAYAQMIEDQREATGQIPSFWETQVYPRVSQVVGLLGTAINGTFAQMLLGAKGFKDGFIDIWESIKKAVTNVLSQILNVFVNAFLKGLAGALTGQQGAWSQAFAGIGSGLMRSGTQSATSQLLGTGASGAAGAAGLAGGGGAGAGGGAAAGGGASLAVLGTVAGAGAGAFVGWKVGRATGSTLKGAGAGAATGAAVGSIAGPVGAGVGAGIGAIAGWLGARKANKDADKEMNAIRDKLVATFGDMDRLRQAAKVVGVDIDEAFKTKGVKGVEAFNKIVGEFETKFNDLDAAAQRYGVTMDELSGKKPVDPFTADVTQITKDYDVLTKNGLSAEQTISKMAPAFNRVLMAALESGQKLPATMEPMLQKMHQMGLVSEDVQRKLLGLSNGVQVDFQMMQEKAQQYGVDLASLGPQFQQARLSETAQTIMADFDMLTKGGASVGGVLFGMKEEISDLVEESIKFGTTIPENMRPLIEELDRSGLLLDENGEKIEGLGRIKFAEPLEAGFDKVVDAIKDLTNVIRGDLPNAVNDAVRDADGKLSSWRPRVPPIELDIEVPEGGYGGYGSYPRGGGYSPPVEGGAAGGVLARRPGLVLFGEGGEKEMGGPVSFMQEALEGALQATGGFGRTIEVRVPLMMDRRQLGEAVFEITPQMLREKGILR